MSKLSLKGIGGNFVEIVGKIKIKKETCTTELHVRMWLRYSI